MYHFREGASRKSWSAPICLSTKTHPDIFDFNFNIDGGMAGIQFRKLDDAPMAKLQCYPLYSLLMALGNPTVNLLSLDIEGSEFEVKEDVYDEVETLCSIDFAFRFSKQFHGVRWTLKSF